MARKRVKSTICPNCDFKFAETNNYCPNCGQENHTHKLPLKHFFLELLESIFHFDTKVLTTLRDLLFKPGEITFNFNQNKRSRYVPPIRLYIFISFIFFLLLAIVPDKDNDKEQIGTDQSTIDLQIKVADDSTHLATIQKDTTAQYLFNKIKNTPVLNNAQIDEYLKASKKDVKWYNRNIYRGWVKFSSGHITHDEYIHKFYKNISSSMFFLMPLFAVYLLLIYRKKKLFYTEHLIFSIHFHSLAFFFLSISQLLNWIHIEATSYIFFIIFIYLIVTLHQVYKQGWIKTILKSFLLSSTYLISLALVLLLGLVLSVIS
jgi:hypothetical protein